MPCVVSEIRIASTTVLRPEITVFCGPLTAAMPTSASKPRSASDTCCCVANTATIDPSRGSALMRRPRATISRRPSSSENTPARQAATYSPTLWPITTAGSTPHDFQSCASAYSTANNAGCVNAVSSSRRATSGSPMMTGIRRAGSSGSAIAAHAFNASRNTDSDSYSSRDMPLYCAP